MAHGTRYEHVIARLRSLVELPMVSVAELQSPRRREMPTAAPATRTEALRRLGLRSVRALSCVWTADASPRAAALPSAPAGVLLHGPTGCGKSFLASVIAAECDANFVAVRASDVASKCVRGSDSCAPVANLG